MANFSRFWATWEIATKLSLGAGLHRPFQCRLLCNITRAYTVCTDFWSQSESTEVLHVFSSNCIRRKDLTQVHESPHSTLSPKQCWICLDLWKNKMLEICVNATPDNPPGFFLCSGTLQFLSLHQQCRTHGEWAAIQCPCPKSPSWTWPGQGRMWCRWNLGLCGLWSPARLPSPYCLSMTVNRQVAGLEMVTDAIANATKMVRLVTRSFQAVTILVTTLARNYNIVKDTGRIRLCGLKLVNWWLGFLFVFAKSD